MFKKEYLRKNRFAAGFTLIELIITVAIIIILSGIILFSVSMYISKSKDSNISANLAVLVPAGEVFYNSNNSYQGFCSSKIVATNAISNMPPDSNTNCSGNVAGLCCKVSSDGNSWAACAKEFTTSSPPNAYCVDSRGVKEDIPNSSCLSSLTQCP